MKITYGNIIKEFGELEYGDVFEICGDFFVKIPPCYERDDTQTIVNALAISLPHRNSFSTFFNFCDETKVRLHSAELIISDSLT